MDLRRVLRTVRKKRAARQTRWFIGVMILLALAVGSGTAFLSNGLHGLFNQASLAQKALDNPATLTEVEKKAAYDSLGDDQKEQARQALGNLSEDEKAKYRESAR